MLLDTFQRPLRNLRLSVTDRCNLRCLYCMPEQDYTWLPKHDVLSFEEIDRLVGIFVGLGVDKLRVTGGEPLLRTKLPVLVSHLARHAAVRDLAMTTNGILLGAFAGQLKDAGLKRVTVESRHAAAGPLRAADASGRTGPHPRGHRHRGAPSSPASRSTRW